MATLRPAARFATQVCQKEAHAERRKYPGERTSYIVDAEGQGFAVRHLLYHYAGGYRVPRCRAYHGKRQQDEYGPIAGSEGYG